MPSTGPPGCAAVTRWAWRRCSGLAHRRGVPATTRRAHHALLCSRRAGRAGRPQPAEDRTWPAWSSSYRWSLSGRRAATGPGSSGLACPGRSAGRWVGSGRGRNAPDRGGTVPTAPDPHRQSEAGGEDQRAALPTRDGAVAQAPSGGWVREGDAPRAVRFELHHARGLARNLSPSPRAACPPVPVGLALRAIIVWSQAARGEGGGRSEAQPWAEGPRCGFSRFHQAKARR